MICLLHLTQQCHGQDQSFMSCCAGVGTSPPRPSASLLRSWTGNSPGPQGSQGCHGRDYLKHSGLLTQLIWRSSGTHQQKQSQFQCCYAGVKGSITHETGSEPSEALYRQLFRSPGQPSPRLLPPKTAANSAQIGSFNLSKGQAFANDLLLTGETAVMSLTGPRTMRCDALALDGGPGGHPMVSLHHYPGWIHAGMPRKSGCESAQPLMDSGLITFIKTLPFYKILP